jgi:hypothetical protein
MASIHFKRNLIHQATIQRNTPATSTSGELIPDWTVVGTIDCRYVQRSERIASESKGFMMVLTDLLLCNVGEDVNEADRVTNIVMRSDESVVNAGPFSIEAVLGRSGTKAHHLSLQLKKVGGVT